MPEVVDLHHSKVADFKTRNRLSSDLAIFDVQDIINFLFQHFWVIHLFQDNLGTIGSSLEFDFYGLLISLLCFETDCLPETSLSLRQKLHQQFLASIALKVEFDWRHLEKTDLETITSLLTS